MDTDDELRQYAAMTPEQHAEAAFRETVDAHLEDTDGFSDWLAAECMGTKRSHTIIRGVPSDSLALAAYIEALDVPQLVALMLTLPIIHGHDAWLELRQRWELVCMARAGRVV